MKGLVRNPVMVSLFLVSGAAVGFEIQLTRFFSIASWAEYGYWVISIAMVGFAAGGVVLSLFRNAFLSRGGPLLFFLPLALMGACCLGFALATRIPFNPLEFQNRELWFGQLVNVWKYYAALFPCFFMAGLYVGLCFLLFPREIPRVYAADLIGAGAGSLFMVAAMYFLDPFYLTLALLPPLGAAAVLGLGFLPPARRKTWAAATGGIFLLSLWGGLSLPKAGYCEYKAVYPALNVEGGRTVRKVLSPRGLYLVLDNFTERLDIDLSNNYSLLGATGPPEAYGLYQDGNRVTNFPKDPLAGALYANASLDILPYRLRPHSSSLLVGTRGGSKLMEIFTAGSSQVTALEPDPMLHSLLTQGFFATPWAREHRVQLLNQSPAGFLSRPRVFDIIDLSAELLGQGDANKFAFTKESLRLYYRCLSGTGMASLPASIREFPVYSLKLLATANQALREEGVGRPADHLVLYRSAWNTRLLVFKTPPGERDLDMIRAFCSERSFDLSLAPGPAPPAREIWNDLPPLVFGEPNPPSDQPRDSISEDGRRILSDESIPYLRGQFFDLSPSTQDRPFFFSILRLGNLGRILENIALIPREEIGYLVNLAVLAQSLLFALGVLLLPLFSRTGRKAGGSPRLVAYFAFLGLGYLFIEIALIEKASYFLGDRTIAFSVILCAMLVFSGIGSALSDRFTGPRGLALGSLLIASWLVLALLFMDPLIGALISLPLPLKCTALVLALAPLGAALGLPFALGLGALGGGREAFVPWAWALNGAFSVVATPLANLVALSAGYSTLVVLSLGLYALVFVTFPGRALKSNFKF